MQEAYTSLMGDPARRLSTVEDLLERPESEHLELIRGNLVEKASPTTEHGLAQGVLAAAIVGPFGRRGGPGRPGGWWILTEVDVELSSHDVVLPDVAGWRRERVPELPRGRPMRIRPDWVCEMLSPSNRRRDTVEKLQLYHRAGVGHYWLVDPDEFTLTVMRHEPDGYKVVLAAGRGETVRAEPFDAIELAVGTLFGDEPDEPEPS